VEPIPFISLDCAGTLIDVDWKPAVFAVDCAERAGVPLDRPTAESNYNRLLQSRWKHYRQLNQSRDEEVGDGFWRELTRDWMDQSGIGSEWFDAIMAEAWEGLYGTESRVFRLFDGVLPALQDLKERGYRLAALSNWDYSLHRVVRMLGLEPYLEVVVASLEEGVEKPEPGIFEVLMSRLGASPGQVAHVGDDPLDDVQGALNFGCRAVLLDRGARIERPVWNGRASRISNLGQLPEVLEWTG
jgi:putative hydrolase of the HAD superfamily